MIDYSIIVTSELASCTYHLGWLMLGRCRSGLGSQYSNIPIPGTPNSTLIEQCVNERSLVSTRNFAWRPPFDEKTPLWREDTRSVRVSSQIPLLFCALIARPSVIRLRLPLTLPQNFDTPSSEVATPWSPYNMKKWTKDSLADVPYLVDLRLDGWKRTWIRLESNIRGSIWFDWDNSWASEWSSPTYDCRKRVDIFSSQHMQRKLIVLMWLLSREMMLQIYSTCFSDLI